MFNVSGIDDPQLLFAETLIFPLVELAVAVMDVEKELPDQPEGNVQVYEVAPATGVMLYILVLPSQTDAEPLMLPGVAGMVLTVTLWVSTADEPQALLAITVIFPVVDPAVVVIDVVVEVPDQPEGKVQV